MQNTRRWYIIQTYSGFENSVKDDLESRIESMGMKDYIFQVLLPEETVIETAKDGKTKEKIKKMFPGYIFVEMIVTDESWFVVRNTPKVTGFLGSSGGGTKPVPLPPDEINALLLKLGRIEKPVLEFAVEDKVTILNGPFAGIDSTILSIDEEKGTVEVTVEMMGRKTSIDLAFKDVKKK